MIASGLIAVLVIAGFALGGTNFGSSALSRSGSADQYQAAVFDTYPSILRQSVVWPTRGNHDMGGSTYAGMFTFPEDAEAGGVASGTPLYYSFDRANIHFICLDSYSSDRSVGGAMWTWAEADLASTLQEWIIAFWHHPPYTKGTHDSDIEPRHIEMRQNALPILEDFGIDLVLGGHSHSYERSFLLDGHYGPSDTLEPSMILPLLRSIVPLSIWVWRLQGELLS